MLITVQNNGWGISTAYQDQHGESCIADRAKGFNIRARVINGNDPLESYLAIREELEYIRSEKRPSFIEARVSRLYGHSSASGANFVAHEECPVATFEKRLLEAGVIKPQEAMELREQYEQEGLAAQNQVKLEPGPTSESIWENVFFGSENADWRKF
jgi:2-oxoisovalerate dehydrogenase E1 component alpha subunit